MIYVMNLICYPKKVNNLERNFLDNFVEIVGVPNINNDDCNFTKKKMLQL
jgi:hypothetical protein